jgi:hypothetical protein
VTVQVGIWVRIRIQRGQTGLLKKERNDEISYISILREIRKNITNFQL